LFNPTVHELVAAARERLREAGVYSADLDARLLAQFVLDWTTEHIVVSGPAPAPDGFESRYGQLVARRAAREPLAYIVGHREFWGLSFAVSPAVLIPRPETELIVEEALALFPARNDRITVIDACTGCGCIAIALASERSHAQVVATDISMDSLDVARRNAETHRVAERIQFVETDLMNGIVGPVDLITCNPPYVATRSRPGLQPEVRDFEPDVALYGGDDGLGILSRVMVEAAQRLRIGGYLLCEFGYGQDIEIEALIDQTAGLTFLEFKRDLQGIARTAVIKRTP